jgi:two-component system, chemotaxis family, sensor kinase CheA
MTSAAARPDEPFFLPAELAEIRRAFFDQGREAVHELDQELLSLEGQPTTPERLKALRRSAHTLKGDFATVGFPKLSTLAHALEDAFVELEQRGGVASARDVDRLLAAVDALRGGLEAGARGEPEPDVTPWLAIVREEGGAPEWERALLEGRQRGMVALRVTLTWRRPREAPAVVALAAQRLGLDVLATGVLCRGARGGGGGVWVAALSSLSLPELERRAPALKGLQVRVEPWEGAKEAAPRAPAAAAPAPETSIEGKTIRIEANCVDDVLTLVGEMVIARAGIAGVASEIEPLLPTEQSTRLHDALGGASRVLQELQRAAMRMRMVPAERVFRRFSRVVRDLKQRTGKDLVLRVEGEKTELDRGILDSLEEPLLHLVRNAADHGIEPAAERVAAGKSTEGCILLRAGREGNQVLVEVADDGRGIDPAAVRARAVSNGLLSAEAADALSDDEALQLVFLPGLSTAAAVTETSGRGIGLDVVRETVEALKGQVRAVNGAGQGTSMVIRVPLTVAIIQALLFRSGGRDVAVPLGAVVEIARREDLKVHSFAGREMFRLRNEVLSLVRPLDLPGPAAGEFVVVVQCSAGRFGLRVDELLGEHELVIKAVHDRWIRTALVAGAAVLPGGGLVLILDVAAVYRSAVAAGGR